MENLGKIKGIGTFEMLGDIDSKYRIYGKTHEERVQELMKVMEVGKVRQADPQPSQRAPYHSKAVAEDLGAAPRT
jgi:hypothetical protein